MGASNPRVGPAARGRALLAASLRLLLFSIRRFQANQGSLRAGGLTYLTLMALVPGLTVVLFIASAFGIKGQLRDYLNDQFEDAPARLVQLKDEVMLVVDRAQLEVIGGLGLLVFVYVVMGLLARVEGALNVTWMAGRARTLARRYADYVAILFLVPVLVLVSTALKTLVAFDDLVRDVPLLQAAVESGVSLLPFLFVWLAGTLLYRVMPNVTVRWGPALVAGLVAGSSWYVAQAVFLRVQIALSRTNAIYGSLALLPFFLIYLHLSWTIVLWGAELCYAVQNRRRLVLPREERQWSPVRRRRLGFTLMRQTVRAFADGRPLSLADFAGETGWPRVIIDEVATSLADAGLLHRVRMGQAVVPGRPPGHLPVAEVLAALDGTEDGKPRLALTPGEEDMLTEAQASLTRVSGVL